MRKNSTLLILALVMVVNALSYGIIIPLLYPYAQRFGIDPLGLSLMFASFSLAQFLATPVLGRLSDRWGRKPVLLLCLLGTAGSLALFASAQSAFMLFIARILDGITGGNISVAQAVIADSTEGKDRAKGFGVLGAAFGFGFLAGPAIGGLLSQYGLTTPFWFAAALALAGTILGQLVMTETLSEKSRVAAEGEPLFNFHHIVQALFKPSIGTVLMLSFLATLSINVFIIGFQSFTTDILKMSPTGVGLLFAMFGLVNIIMQMVGIRWLLEKFPSKKQILFGSFLISAGVLFVAPLAHTAVLFAIILLIHMIASSPQNPMITALLSERTKEEDQGGLLGINQSYVSLGQIFGPIAGGAVAKSINVPSVFILSAILFAACAVAIQIIMRKPQTKFDL
jgi:MFS family permease